jgi:RHH-type transcriptional regulator, proline utilization regulon repressor / proline dehydrogenase / delta 1-pyrroline-5-carboxylate dehydrogenase
VDVATTLGTRARELLSALHQKPLSPAARAEKAVSLAELLLRLSRERTTRTDRQRSRMLSRMMRDRPGQQFTAALTDRLFRSRDDRRVLDQVDHLLARFGTPAYMQSHERVGLRSLRVLSPLLAPLLAPAVRKRVRDEARALLLDADERALSRELAERRAAGVRVNVNQLGEALLGEREAALRVQKYVALAGREGIDALSVKASSIASQLNLLAFDDTVALTASRLAAIYRGTLVRPESERALVMLDMEAYEHVELTIETLVRALDDRSLDRVHAGIVLQAYLPDANELLERLLVLSATREQRGGLPLRVRLVKGANLAHERVESSKAGVTLPIYASKREVDANYKRLLTRVLSSGSNLALGVASHNLFDLAYALVMRAELAQEARVELELLAGMAEPVRRALAELSVGVLVYAPICRDEELTSGIAYLVRRLDENTASDNYLNASFDMAPASAPFERERKRFESSLALIDSLDASPRRVRDENHDRAHGPRATPRALGGELDSDFTRARNRAWIEAALHTAREAPVRVLRSCIAGEWDAGQHVIDGSDPSRPACVPYRVALADAQAIERALSCAASDPSGFSALPVEARAHLLLACAAELRRARGALIATLVLDGGKRVVEADAEVSEAIDFATYYAASFERLAREGRATFAPRGVVLVTPPWNFPLAIAAGGIFAGLMAGCRVLFKPALETPLIGERLATLLYRAGVPATALQLVLAEDDVASALVQDARVHSVILTGATSTACLFQQLRPGLRLLAETGGKNAFVVSAMSDRELAIRDAVHSAFGHAGQKCSAASLLICEREVYDDEGFRATLRDAVESLHVGSAWDLRSFVTPLIRPPEGALARALHTLEPGESWLLEPRAAADNPRLIHPGIKLGVSLGSFTHQTELFGPLLGVMRADSLAHAVSLANATGYGLTAGLASLDEREQQYFVEHTRVGNVYVNRTTTGAIVERQPFGGIGKSGFGPGAKAGGPNYVAQLCHVRERALPSDVSSPALPEQLEARVVIFARALDARDEALLRTRTRDYARAWAEHFAREHDPARVLGQHNRFRYRACPGVLLRVERDAAPVDIASSCLAAELAGAPLQVSMDGRARAFQDSSVLMCPLHVESAEELLARAPKATRMRVLGTRRPLHDQLNVATGVHVADEPVLALGRFELLHYLFEQSLSIEYHRYGNLGAEHG